MRGLWVLPVAVLCCGVTTLTTDAKTPAPSAKSVDITRQLATLTRTKSLRSNLCWRRFYDARRSINRQRQLLLRYASYPCDKKAWRRCHRQFYASPACKTKATRLRFGACFRMHRRLFVISYRLLKWRREARKAKCRWRLKIPASFAAPVFAPYPKLTKK